jgi:hypothetical protein
VTSAEERVSRPIFRVSFSGPALERTTLSAALDAADLRWEGSESRADESIERHRALVGAASEDEAIAIALEALAGYGTFREFEVTPVLDARGEITRTPLRTQWREVYWKSVERKVTLDDLERLLISTLLNAAEPTWIILRDPDVPDDPGRVEAALHDLERRGLVYSTWEPAGDPGDFGVLESWHGRPERMCHWWALTDRGWDLLGLIKSPGYR